MRNGSTPKTLKTELGEVPVPMPRDRQGSFDPHVGKRQTRLPGLDERGLDVYAGGMTVRDIASHLQRLYCVETGRYTISRVTDAVLGIAVAGACYLLGPELVVVGGELARAGELLLEPLRAAVRRATIDAVREVDVIGGVLGERAEVLGAVALVLRESQRFVAEPAMPAV